MCTISPIKNSYNKRSEVCKIWPAPAPPGPGKRGPSRVFLLTGTRPESGSARAPPAPRRLPPARTHPKPIESTRTLPRSTPARRAASSRANSNPLNFSTAPPTIWGGIPRTVPALTRIYQSWSVGASTDQDLQILAGTDQDLPILVSGGQQAQFAETSKLSVEKFSGLLFARNEAARRAGVLLGILRVDSIGFGEPRPGGPGPGAGGARACLISVPEPPRPGGRSGTLRAA